MEASFAMYEDSKLHTGCVIHGSCSLCFEITKMNLVLEAVQENRV